MISSIEFSDPSDPEIKPEVVTMKGTKEQVRAIPALWLRWKSEFPYEDFQSFTEYVMSFMDWTKIGKWEFFSPDQYLTM